MKKISRRVKRLLTILLVEIVIAVNVLSAYAFEDNSFTYTDQEVQLMQAAIQGENTDTADEGEKPVDEGKDSAGENGANGTGDEEKDSADENDVNGTGNEEKDSADENDVNGTGDEGKDSAGENGANGTGDEGKDGTEEAEDTKGASYDIADWIDDVQLSYCKDGIDGSYIPYDASTTIYSGYGLKANVAFSVPQGITITDKDQLVFTLPDFLSGIVDAKDGIIVEKDSTTPIGKYEIISEENGGKLLLSYDKSYFENGGSISYGAVSFKGLMNVTDEITSERVETLYFGNCPVTVRLAPLDSRKGGLSTQDWFISGNCYLYRYCSGTGTK